MTVTRGSSKIRVKNNGSVQKTIFNESSYGINKNKSHLSQHTDINLDETPAYVPTISSDLLDKEDDKNDDQVTEILKLLKKIEDFSTVLFLLIFRWTSTYWK